MFGAVLVVPKQPIAIGVRIDATAEVKAAEHARVVIEYPNGICTHGHAMTPRAHAAMGRQLYFLPPTAD